MKNNLKIIWQEIIDFCHDRNGLVQLIENSDAFKREFSKFIQAMEANPAPDSKTRVKDMGSAKHRHASLADVLKRAVMYFEALVQTATHIKGSRGKATREYRIADEFLAWITNEKALLMGMLADYYVESVELLRYC